MKKLLCILLPILLLAMTACTAPEEQTKTPLEQAKAYIAEGHYQQAYDLLLSIDAPTAEEKTLLKGFRYFPELCDYNGSTTNYTYDDFGNCLSEERRTSLGNIYFYEYTYDGNGNVLTKTYITGYEQTSAVEQTDYIYTYDDNGNLLTEQMKQGETGALRTNTYNDRGQLTYQVYVYTGKYTEETTYTYDARGYLILEESNVLRTDNTTAWSRAEHTYDDTSDENRRVHIKRKTDSSGGERTETYIYDADGLLLEEGYQILGGVWEKKEYTYDAAGNQLTYKQSSGDYEGSEASYWHQQTFAYNEDGNVIMETTVNHKNDGQVIQYVYDKYGNCVKKEWVDGGILVAQTFTYILLYNPDFAKS